MHFIFLTVLLSIALSCNATAINGPYIFWGDSSISNLQPKALVEANEKELSELFRNVKAILVFVRNTTSRLEGTKYPKFQNLVKSNAWTYLPQRYLAVEPFNYNANVEVITLGGENTEDDEQLISCYNDAVAIYGSAGEVLGILAHRDDDSLTATHFVSKREAKENEEEDRTTTAQTPTTDETEKTFVYVADGKKAVLSMSSAPVLTLGKSEKNLTLREHMKAITFDDQKTKGYGRLNINFVADNEKVFLRFNFTLNRGTWYMNAVEVGYKDLKTVLPAIGNSYTIPSAPLGFSYRCSAYNLVFSNKNDTLVISDFRVQPWLNGREKFGDSYDCVGFTTAPILAGVLVSFFLCGILAIGITMMLDMHTPNRFESSRNKQLQLTVQE